MAMPAKRVGFLRWLLIRDLRNPTATLEAAEMRSEMLSQHLPLPVSSLITGARSSRNVNLLRVDHADNYSCIGSCAFAQVAAR